LKKLRRLRRKKLTEIKEISRNYLFIFFTFKKAGE